MVVQTRCACYYTPSKECQNTAVYQQNGYVNLCQECFGEITEKMFNYWYKWNLSNKKEHEPPLWVFNRTKVRFGNLKEVTKHG